ncbi:hypothetical protein LCGC14_2671310 [marine sediment metagenome]|uniref:Uncharacterized protein n=1 Tax=marine sediment metagenome TaxID=412755 RepID=A0A0F9ABG2_9ZZZZ
MDVYDNRETALWDLTEKEIEYLSQFSDLERKGDMKDLLEFLGIVESWNPMIRGENPLQFNIFEANGFNYTVNKILHKYLGFDKRIAKDFFFRRLHTITRQEFYNNELKKKDYYIRFEIDLWGGFSIDQLVPEMFKELEGVIDIKKIRYITIQAGSLNGTISENLFEHVPNVEAIHFEFNGPIAIPAGLLDTTTSVKEIGLINVSDLPFDVFKDAYIDTGIFVLQKGEDRHNKTLLYEFPKKTKIENLDIIHYKEIDQILWKSNKMQILGDSDIIFLISKLSNNSFKLGDITDSVRGILATPEFISTKQQDGYYQFFDAEMYRYEILSPDKFIFSLTHILIFRIIFVKWKF